MVGIDPQLRSCEYYELEVNDSIDYLHLTLERDNQFSNRSKFDKYPTYSSSIVDFVFACASYFFIESAKYEMLAELFPISVSTEELNTTYINFPLVSLIVHNADTSLKFMTSHHTYQSNVCFN